MHTIVQHNHHICWTSCPSRKLVLPRSSKDCINCMELIATKNFLRGWASSPEVRQLMLLQHGVQTEKSCWKKDAGMALLLYCHLHDNVTLHTVKWSNSGSGSLGVKCCNVFHMVQTKYFQTSVFCSFQKGFWCENDEFDTLHFMDFFADHFDVLSPAGADTSVEALTF